VWLDFFFETLVAPLAVLSSTPAAPAEMMEKRSDKCRRFVSEFTLAPPVFAWTSRSVKAKEFSLRP